MFSKFMVISMTLDDFVLDSQKKRLSDIIFHQRLLMTLIFCMRGMSHTVIEDKPQIYHYKTLVYC